MRKRILSFLANAALAVVSVILALVVVEIALPFFKVRTIEEAVYQARRPVVQAVYGEYHPQLRFTLQKNLRDIRIHYPGQLDYTLNTNSYGFRGEDWDLSPGRKNVILLGDSFAFGWGVSWDRTAGKILERELRKSDPAWQVINLSMSGYSITEVITVLELYGKLLKPLAVVYLFCPNDIDGMVPPVSPGVYDIAYHRGPEDEAAFKALVVRNQPGYRSWNKFFRKSYLKAFHARIIRPLFSKRIKSSLRVDRPPQGFDFPPSLASGGPPPDTPESRFLLYGLKRLHRDGLGAPLYLVTTSDKSILVKKDSVDNLRWVLSRFSEETPGVHFADFERVARETPGSRSYFLDYDDHWSPEGHAVAARLLLAAMRETPLRHQVAKP